MPNDVTVPENKPITRDGLIAAEARHMAREAIQTELEKADLPLPRDSVLDAHIDALLSARPDFLTAAEARVEAKQDAYSRALRAIGIEPIVIEAIDLDLLDAQDA